jgi:hypothetical protein
MSTQQKQPEKTKPVKALITNEDGDLVYGIIHVPLTDKRPEWTGGPLNAGTGAQPGNPAGDRPGAVKGF